MTAVRCGRSFDGAVCGELGSHLCEPRSGHAVAFFEEILCHTKGRWARRPFILADWQREDIVVPLFGKVRWHEDAGDYARQYSLAWIEIARKNGKSELLAGIALYLLCADGEEGAEVYGVACDRDQARKVYDVAERMVMLSPELKKRLVVKSSAKRIIYPDMGGYYEVAAADALGNLGHNPHGVVFDEIVAQPSGALWDSFRTAMGARTQALMVAATTAGMDPTSFAGREHLECARIAEEPQRAPHRFCYVRNVPNDADPWDESKWPLASPALEDFLSVDALREEAIEARNDPSKENAFRAYRLNQWVRQASRWMPMHVYDACAGQLVGHPDDLLDMFEGRTAWGGLDLSAKHDLTAWALLLPPSPRDVKSHLLFRFWIPEDGLADLDQATGGLASVWARDEWLTVTDGSVIDYERVYAELLTDAKLFPITEVDYDKWCGEPVRQAVEEKLGARMVPIDQTYAGMTFPMTELMALVKGGGVEHHGNPVARWCFDSVEVKRGTENPDLIKPVKPVRGGANKRIDAVPAAALAVGGWRTRGGQMRRKTRAMGF